MSIFVWVVARLTLGRDSAVLLKRAGALYSEYRRKPLPRILIDTLIVAEDHRFRHHGGVDPVAAIAAIWRFITQGRLTGASTITQQLVRVLTGRYERTVVRKLREIGLAVLLHKEFLPDDLAGMYLSVAYFGAHMNGARQACQRLGIEGSAISLRQAAQVIARLKYPEAERESTRRLEQIVMRTEYLVLRYTRLLAAYNHGQVNPDEAVLDLSSL